jgi:hypothetical protein
VFFYSEHIFSETGFYSRLQVEPTQFCTVGKATFCLRRQKMETESSVRYVMFEIKDRILDNVQNSDNYKMGQLAVPEQGPIMSHARHVNVCAL